MLHDLSINADGYNLYTGLTLYGGFLYGVAVDGGSANNGTLFCIGTNGGFTNLHSFSATSGSTHTNSEGANPEATLLAANNSLYGLGNAGGAYGHGTLFKYVLPGPALGVTAASGANRS